MSQSCTIFDNMLKVEIYNIKPYELWDGLVIWGDIIPHDTLTENCEDIVLNFSNIKLGEDELSISHRVGEKTINGIDNLKIFLKPIRKELVHRIFLCHLWSKSSVLY